MAQSPPSSSVASQLTEREILLALYDLGRRVASVVDLDELLHKIPELIGRLIPFDAFAVYLYEERRDLLTIAHAVGYPRTEGVTRKAAEGIVGRVLSIGQPILVGDITLDARYLEVVPGMLSTVAVPLIHKKRTIGVLNLLSRTRNTYTERDTAIVRQFGAHVATAIANARLLEQARLDADAFETLAEIGREIAAVLDLDELLPRVAQLACRVIDYRTLGILLLDEETNILEMQMAVQYGEHVEVPKVPLGEGLVGYAALHREPVLVADVSKDPRYIKLVDDVRSELAVPLLLKDRCLGVLDLESPELDAFTKRDVEILTLLASQVAVAIENARLYEEVRANKARLEKELRFAQRVQAALLPQALPRRIKGVDVAASFAPARELGGDFHDLLVPQASTLIVAVGDVSGKGVPAALYSAFAAELVRGRSFRGRYLPERAAPGKVLTSINTILHDRQLEEYYCTLCYALFDLRRRKVTIANSGLPYPVRASGDTVEQVQLPGVPLGSFTGVTYDEIVYPIASGDVFVFCSDGVFEAMNARGDEFGAERLMEIVRQERSRPARQIADAIGLALEAHRAGFPPNDDTTLLVVRFDLESVPRT